MKKLFLIFLFLIPNVLALAATPVVIDFGVAATNGTIARELYIFNNLEKSSFYSLTVGNFSGSFSFEPNFSLKPFESKVIAAKLTPLNLNKGNYSSFLFVEEHVESEGTYLVNRVGIKLLFKVNGNFSGEKNQLSGNNIFVAQPINGLRKEKVTGLLIRKLYSKNKSFLVIFMIILALMLFSLRKSRFVTTFKRKIYKWLF